MAKTKGGDTKSKQQQSQQQKSQQQQQQQQNKKTNNTQQKQQKQAKPQQPKNSAPKQKKQPQSQLSHPPTSGARPNATFIEEFFENLFTPGVHHTAIKMLVFAMFGLVSVFGSILYYDRDNIHAKVMLGLSILLGLSIGWVILNWEESPSDETNKAANAQTAPKSKKSNKKST